MTDTTNPLLKTLRLPGETYRLPSRGLFYAAGGILDPSVVDGEVEVLPMTAIDEIVLNTPDKLLSGDAIREVLMRCVPSIRKPEDLLIEDVDFLMVCLRHVSFGAVMEIEFKHDCDHALNHTYQVDVLDIIRKTTTIDPTVLSTQYVMTMPNGQVVKLRPASYKHIIKLFQTTALTKTSDMTDAEAHTLIMETFTGLIASVDDTSDEAMIREWLDKIPLGWKRTIEQHIRKLNTWGVDFAVKTTCQDCHEPFDLVVNPNPVSFFS
jgi:hypothetical protein